MDDKEDNMDLNIVEDNIREKGKEEDKAKKDNKDNIIKHSSMMDKKEKDKDRRTRRRT